MKRQRGYYMVGPSLGELGGCLAIVSVFLIGVGVFLAWLGPKVWAWVKPMIHALTA